MTEEYRRTQRRGTITLGVLAIVLLVVFFLGVGVSRWATSSGCDLNAVRAEVMVTGEETSVLCISMVEFNELDADGRIAHD